MAEVTTLPEVKLEGPVKVTALAVAPSNRTVVKKEGLEELAASIKGTTLIEPVVVRPVNGHYEIIAGHRRVEAIKLAGFAEVPPDWLRVLDVDDVTAEAMRLAENLNREDMHPVDELGHYERLLALGKTREDIVRLTGKADRYVQRRLVLTSLDERARKAFRDGKIGYEVAYMIARIPQADDRVKALRQALGSGGYQPGARDMAHWIEQNVMLALVDYQGQQRAPFPLDVEIGGVVSCVSCPKRTGNQPVLFDPKELAADERVSKQLCTDGVCYQKKSEVFLAAEAARLKGLGHGVLDPKGAAEKAKKAIKAGTLKNEPIDLTAYYGAAGAPAQQALGKLFKDKCLGGCVDFAYLQKDGRYVPHCFNEPNLKALLKQARGEKAERDKLDERAAKGDRVGATTTDRASDKFKREQRSRKITETAEASIDGWLVDKVPALLGKVPVMVLRMALTVACLQYRESAEGADDAKGMWKKLGFDPTEYSAVFGSDAWKAIAKLPDKKVAEVLHVVLARMAPKIDRAILYDVGAKVGVVPAKQYQMTADDLATFSKDELEGVAKELGLGEVMGGSKSEMVDYLAKKMKPGKLPKGFEKVAAGGK